MGPTLVEPDLLVFDRGVPQIRRILIDLRVRSVQLDGLQEVLHLLVLLGVDSVVKLVQEEVVALLFLLLLLFCKHLEILLSFFHGLLRDQVEWRRHLLGYLWPLDLAHGLPHLVFVWVGEPRDLVGRGYLPLRDLVSVLDLEMWLEIIVLPVVHGVKLCLHR